MNTRKPLFAGCALLALAIAAPAFAQAPAPIQVAAAQPPEEEGTRVGEVTVTAEKRAQNLQDVPIAITAMDDKQRETIGIVTIGDLSQFTPGLYYNTATDRPAIRGIGRQSNTFSLDSPVASYVDGVYTSSVQDAARRPMFIERTEILRGPQGALGGRGSIAGSINTISKMPSKSFGGAVGVSGGSYERYGGEVTVTGPITEWLQGRLNLSARRQGEGYFENAADDKNEGNNLENRTTADVLFTAQLGEKFDFFAKAGVADYKEKRRSSSSLAPYIAGTDPCIPGLGAGTSPSSAYGLFGPGLGCGQVRLTVAGIPTGNPLNSPTVVPFDNQADILGTTRTNPNTLSNLRNYNSNYPAVQQLQDPNSHNYTFWGTYHAPWFDAKYIYGDLGYHYHHETDADESPVNSYLVGAATYNAANPASPIITSRRISPGTINQYAEIKKIRSNELNFASTTEGPISWVAGIYESRENYDQNPQNIYAPGFASALANPSAYEFGAFSLTPSAALRTPPPNLNPTLLTYGHLVGETISRAAFAQATWEVAPKWTLTGGLRYNNDDKVTEEDARFLKVTSTAAGDTVVDDTYVNFRGYSVIADPATATVKPVIPKGYRVVDVSQYPMAPAGVDLPGQPAATSRVLPDGSYVAATGSALLFAPGVVGFPSMDPATGARRRSLANDWHALTGSANVQYAFNDDTNVYLRYSRGYRPGGFNSGFINSVPETEPEFVNAYEIGAKMTINGSLRINTAAFHYDYTDIQLPLPLFDRCTTPGDITTCVSVNSFVNLPTATSDGFELEALWYPTANLQVTGSYGYVDAKIKNGKTISGFQNSNDPSGLLPTAKPLFLVGTVDLITGKPNVTQDLSGNPVVASPKHKVAVNVAYTFRDVMDLGNLTLSGTYIWRAKSYGDLFASENAVTPAYDQTNLRAIFEDKDKKYQLIAYVQNVFDETVAEFAGVTRRSIAGPGTGQTFYQTFDLAPPRVFGVEVQRRF